MAGEPIEERSTFLETNRRGFLGLAGLLTAEILAGDMLRNIAYDRESVDHAVSNAYYFINSASASFWENDRNLDMKSFLTDVEKLIADGYIDRDAVMVGNYEDLVPLSHIDELESFDSLALKFPLNFEGKELFLNIIIHSENDEKNRNTFIVSTLFAYNNEHDAQGEILGIRSDLQLRVGRAG